MTQPFPWRICPLDVTPSTNDEAKKAAEAGEAEGLVICARTQTAGRGRHGRGWESPEGNLYCSMLLRPGGNARDLGAYGFVAALAVHDVVKELLPRAAITLKWPNDVLAGSKKISGVLLEAGEGYLICGIGLNILHHPADALYPAASLKSLGAAAPPVPEILARLLDHFSRWLGVLRGQGFAPLRKAWLDRAHKGRVSVCLADKVLEGDFADLGEDGRLLLQLADGSEQAISAGDVFFSG